MKNPAVILIADDDDDDVFFFSVALEECATETVLFRAKDGNELMQMLKDKMPLPDLLFLDLEMPYKDGIQCIKAIRENPCFAGLSIIVYSSSRDKRNIDFCFEAGCSLYVLKPSGYFAMKKMLHKILQKVSCGRDATRNRTCFYLAD